STLNTSSGSTRSPRVATLPFTETRPSAIQTSSSRREPSPARASTFCNFSLIGRTLFIGRHVGRLLLRRLRVLLIGRSALLFRCTRIRPAAEFRFKIGDHRVHLFHAHQGGFVDLRL